MIDQSFVHNLNPRISQVSASGNSLVPIPTAPSGPTPIPPFVTIAASTAGQYFGRQGTRQLSDNIGSSVSINRRPCNGPVYDDKVNCLTWPLVQKYLILIGAVVRHSKNNIANLQLWFLSWNKSFLTRAITWNKHTYAIRPFMTTKWNQGADWAWIIWLTLVSQ